MSSYISRLFSSSNIGITKMMLPDIIIDSNIKSSKKWPLFKTKLLMSTNQIYKPYRIFRSKNI